MLGGLFLLLPTLSTEVESLIRTQNPELADFPGLASQLALGGTHHIVRDYKWLHAHS